MNTIQILSNSQRLRQGSALPDQMNINLNKILKSCSGVYSIHFAWLLAAYIGFLGATCVLMVGVWLVGQHPIFIDQSLNALPVLGMCCMGIGMLTIHTLTQTLGVLPRWVYFPVMFIAAAIAGWNLIIWMSWQNTSELVTLVQGSPSKIPAWQHMLVFNTVIWTGFALLSKRYVQSPWYQDLGYFALAVMLLAICCISLDYYAHWLMATHAFLYGLFSVFVALVVAIMSKSLYLQSRIALLVCTYSSMLSALMIVMWMVYQLS